MTDFSLSPATFCFVKIGFEKRGAGWFDEWKFFNLVPHSA